MNELPFSFKQDGFGWSHKWSKWKWYNRGQGRLHEGQVSSIQSTKTGFWVALATLYVLGFSFILTSCSLVKKGGEKRGGEWEGSAATPRKINEQLIVEYSDPIRIRAITRRSGALPQTCPVLQVSTSPEAGVFSLLHMRPQKFPVQDQNADFSQVDLCTAEVSPSSQRDYYFRWNQQQVHVPAQVRRLAILGDTGCRLRLHSQGADFYQDCDNSKAWPFQRLVQSVLKEDVDLVVHVGDYHYRDPCDAPQCVRYRSTMGYGWPAWEVDFLSPASDLLSSKPWVFVRGNHEDYGRAYAGFFNLLTGVSKNPVQDLRSRDGGLPHVATQFMERGGVLLINMDNASLGDFPLPPESPIFAELDREIEKINARVKASSAPVVLLLMHRPVWIMYTRLGFGQGVNVNMRRALDRRPLDPRVNLVISGHIHDFQISQNPGQHRPVQVLMGASGTLMDPVPVSLGTRITDSQGGAQFSPPQQASDFSYLVLDLGNQETRGKLGKGEGALGLRGVVKSSEGIPKYDCFFSGNQADCRSLSQAQSEN